jgi:hypothetical protein
MMSDDINTGRDMWQDHKNHYGIITAHVMCIRYLDMQKNKTNPEERAFCDSFHRQVEITQLRQTRFPHKRS